MKVFIYIYARRSQIKKYFMKHHISICLLVLSFSFINVHAQIIINFAGVNGFNYLGDGGPATAAIFHNPNAVCADAAGNVYITDLENNVVRKVNAAGIINTIVGNSVPGYSGDGGPATNAQLSGPVSVKTDHAGNVYISELNNGCIRKVNTSGIITTIAGNGTTGYSGDGGPATDATLNHPCGFFIDGSGNIYIADALNNCIRMINASGIISTIAGSATSGYSGDGGPATAALLYGPIDITGDREGNLYVADNENNAVRKINTSGIITTVAGTGVLGYSGDGGSATAAMITYPMGVCIDAVNNLYIADNGNARIRKVNTSGMITTFAGGGTSGYIEGGLAVESQLGGPGGMAFDTSGNMYFADISVQVIRKIIINGIVNSVLQVNNTPISDISVYPNPTVSKINIEITSTLSQEVNITLYNTSGTVVHGVSARLYEGENTIAMDIDNMQLPAGNYYIVMHRESGADIVKTITLIPNKN